MRAMPWQCWSAVLPLAVLLTIAPLAARAVEMPPPARIAILDFDHVMRESVAAKDIRRQIQASA